MVIDELLVGERAARDPVVTARLAALGASDTGATVFGGLAAPPSEDVQIWRLASASGARPYPGRRRARVGRPRGRSWRGTSR